MSPIPPVVRAMSSIRKNAWTTGRTPRVCVVGAGVSGLVCAWRLSQEGIDVTMLEGRHRVGGRVYQEKVLGHWADMGANWIHGPDKNPIRNLAKDIGAITVDIDETMPIYDETGQLLPNDRVQKLQVVLWDAISDAFEYAMSHDDIPVTMSLKDFMFERINGRKDMSTDDKRLVLQMSEFWGGYIGTPYERQSLKYLFLEGSLEGENVFVASTYKDILDNITTRALEHAKIRFGATVTSIQMQGDKGETSQKVESLSSAVPSSAKRPTPVEPDSYDAAVVTIPLGSLRKQQIKFDPELSIELNYAIDSISYGNLEKVYLRFPSAFWHTSADPQPFFRRFLHPLYTDRNPQKWDMSMISLSAASKDHANVNQPTLLFYIYGPCGTHVTNLVRGLKQGDPEHLSRLADFFYPYFSRLPNFDSGRKDCTPVAALSTAWQQDPLAGFGSYTNWQIDDNEKYDKPPKMPLDRAIEVLRHGLPERRLFFAGEHTAPFDQLGTVTGAYVSGESVAQRIIDSFKEN